MWLCTLYCKVLIPNVLVIIYGLGGLRMMGGMFDGGCSLNWWDKMEISGLTKLPVTSYKEPNMKTFKTPFFYHGHASVPATPAAAPAGKLNAILQRKKGKKKSRWKK